MAAIILVDSERSKCEIWTRCVGYMRPTSDFNIGKRQEAKERIYYNEEKALKSSVA